MKFFIFIYILVSYMKISRADIDKPCAARPIENESVICVCNSTYCDNIVRDHPEYNTFVVYSSSKGGQRFKKSIGYWSYWREAQSMNETYSSLNVEINPLNQYQTVVGFGGGLSDSVAMNWKSLSPVMRESFIQAYFGEYGLEYNMIRTPIGGSDYSTHPYAYNDLPRDDAALTNYTFTTEDIMYKIPMFKAIMKVAKVPVYVIASTWSPPRWMKNSETIFGYDPLNPKYYQTYADYHLKFIELYTSAGIPIWAITTTNEPINGILELTQFNTVGWTVKGLGEWVVNHLGPTIRNSKFRDVKIIYGDDQRLTIPYWFYGMYVYSPQLLDFIDGFGVHFYTDKVVPPIIYDTISLTLPNKFIITTEACTGSYPWETIKVVYGSWERAKAYIISIIQDLNYNLIGWLDWNMCLDPQGGPNWAGNFVDSPIIVHKERQEFIKQPMFYAMGHFSKFIPRGSIRIEINETDYCMESQSLYKTAFVTPRNTIVVNLYNEDRARNINLRIGKQQATLHMAADSINTVEFRRTQSYY